jgi:peptidoglycan hydrolase-like protein with peptidoglycan-binding domain
MGLGYLKFEIRTADGVLPIEGADITVSDLKGNVLLTTKSDANGDTDVFPFDAPDKALSLDEYATDMPYAEYNVEVIKDGFNKVNVYHVNIFDGEESILPVDMHPNSQGGRCPVREAVNNISLRGEVLPCPLNEESIYIPENTLRIENAFDRQTGSNAPGLRDVFIPEFIRVHLGVPTNAQARTVRVRFIDYIKNVASSEIYPTWPTAALTANIHAIVTFTLNRIFTEWYPSRGFNFDITNSTQFDQFFVYGRNIFESISRIVDNVFSTYARRFGFRNPFFTTYRAHACGANCLSQWGTVTLAGRGFTPLQMLRHYYTNDIELVTTDNIQAITESFPGTPLSIGSSGANVQRIQNFLNRIRINFPLIPRIENPNGFFSSDTDAAVRQFQRSFNLPITGVVDRATWNRITQIFVGVSRLAEIDSEGDRVTIGQNPPTTVLRQGSRGADVMELQFIINRLSAFYSDIPTLVKDGVFGPNTRDAVIAFQRRFGLTPDGVVGPITWNALYREYRNVANVYVPEQPPVPPDIITPYPGVHLREGTRGPSVMLMQNYLNALRDFYMPAGPPLLANGVFDSRTRAEVMAFQRYFSYIADGIIGPVTWNKISEMYALMNGQG